MPTFPNRPTYWPPVPLLDDASPLDAFPAVEARVHGSRRPIKARVGAYRVWPVDLDLRRSPVGEEPTPLDRDNAPLWEALRRWFEDLRGEPTTWWGCYHLKHVVERYAEAHVQRTYVPMGAFVVAAAAHGVPIKLPHAPSMRQPVFAPQVKLPRYLPDYTEAVTLDVQERIDRWLAQQDAKARRARKALEALLGSPDLADVHIQLARG